MINTQELRVRPLVNYRVTLKNKEFRFNVVQVNNKPLSVVYFLEKPYPGSLNSRYFENPEFYHREIITCLKQMLKYEG